MRTRAVLVVTMVAVGSACACSDDSGGGGNSAGTGGASGMGGGAGMGGAGGSSGSAGSTNGGAAGAPAPATPALPPGSPTVACSMQLSGSLDSSDRTQTGRHSRIAPISACGATKGFPGNAADPSNPHLFDVYRFANPSAAAVCFNFTLTDGASGPVESDAGADGGLDAGADGLDAGTDAASDAAVASAAPPKYMTAYSTFYPTDLSQGYLGDVGDKLTAPQAMGITVPAGGTIDVVVYATEVAPAGVGAYTLSCSMQ